MLRFHKNPSFERRKKTKNRCSGAWISGFPFCGAWNLTGCLHFYIRLWKNVHIVEFFFFYANTLKKNSGKSADLFSFVIF